MPPQQNEQPCPQCGSMMSYRLGEFECESCGLRQPASAPQEERSSGPGFRKEQSGGGAGSSHARSQGGSNYPLPGHYQSTSGAPPSPPPDSTFDGEQNVDDSTFDANTPPSTGSLKIEKNIYFGIHVAVFGVLVVILFNGASIAGLAPGPGLLSGASGALTGIILGNIVGGIIVLIVLWLVLFRDLLWLKWVGAGCTALLLLWLLISSFIPAASKMESGFDIGSGILELGLYGWCLSILWRDIRRLQSYR